MKRKFLFMALWGFVFSYSNFAQNQRDSVTDSDNNVYHTVAIGNQIWIVENLKTTHYNNGDPIPNISNPTQWSYQTVGTYCDYKNKPKNSEIYGRLYNWYAMNDSRKICPSGFHVPTSAEWDTLIVFLGDSIKAVRRMKETGSMHWKGANESSNNSSGFTALPGGFRAFEGTFVVLGKGAYWWASNANKDNEGYYTFIFSGRATIGRDTGADKEPGHSVRCIKDK